MRIVLENWSDHGRRLAITPELWDRMFEPGPQTEKGRWWRYRLPGHGVVAWPRYITALQEAGYGGVLSIEHEDVVWGWGTDTERAKRGLILAKRFLVPYVV